MYKGIVFDLDDTLISSGLDFAKIRKTLEIPEGIYILEFIDQMAREEEKVKARKVVEDHEAEAAHTAILQPGIEKTLKELERANVRAAVLTRNCKAATRIILEKLNLNFETVLTRECAPAKPNPEGLLQIVDGWQVEKVDVIYVGDFIFDIQVARNAGVDVALYTPGELPKFADQADITFSHYDQFIDKVFKE